MRRSTIPDLHRRKNGGHVIESVPPDGPDPYARISMLVLFVGMVLLEKTPGGPGVLPGDTPFERMIEMIRREKGVEFPAPTDVINIIRRALFEQLHYHTKPDEIIAITNTIQQCVDPLALQYVGGLMGAM